MTFNCLETCRYKWQSAYNRRTDAILGHPWWRQNFFIEVSLADQITGLLCYEIIKFYKHIFSNYRNIFMSIARFVLEIKCPKIEGLLLSI